VFKMIKAFIKEEDGINTVEIVVIVAVLVGLALIFRKAIFSFVNQVLDKLFNSGGDAVAEPGSGDIQDRDLE